MATTSISADNMFTQVTYDVAGEQLTDARSVGILDPGRSVLDIDSALSGKDNDTLDNYKFTLTKDAPIGLTATQSSNLNLRVQLLNKAGQVVADSAAVSGKLKDAWTDLTGSNYAGKAGTYYVRVQRGAGVAKSADETYSLRVNSGFDYRQDFDTVEQRQQSSTASATPISASLATLNAQLTASTNNVFNEKSSQTQNLLTGLLNLNGVGV